MVRWKSARMRPLRPFAMGLAMALLAGALATAVTLVQAQTSPSIEIELSPHHSVPRNTAITGTVTLRGLDPTAYSSVIFRADAEQFISNKYPVADDYLGEDINTDVTVDVDSATEVFTISVFEACDLNIYAHYQLDITVTIENSNVPGGKIVLTTASSRFAMNRYLETGVPTATPPSPDAIAWLDPDPSTVDMTVHGEWHEFRVRADVNKYFNDHVGVIGFGQVDGALVSSGSSPPSQTIEEVCGERIHEGMNWRRAINQAFHVAICKEGEATIQVRHETDPVPALAEYSFTVGSVSPPPPPPPTPTPTPTTTSTGGGFGGLGPAPVAPAFRDGFRATRDVAENTSAGEAVGKPIVATHPDDLALEYTMSGADAALFAMDAATGQIRVGAGTALDFESGRHTYTVNVTATDTSGTGALITVTIGVTDIDLGPYDLDGNERIERGEVIASISDYFKSIIGKDEVIQLIRLYFAS